MGAKQSSKNDDILEVVDGNIHEVLSDVPPDIQKEDFDLPNRTAEVHFLLHDVLSKDECEKIINAGMELGFKKVIPGKEDPIVNQRGVVWVSDPEFSQKLWSRVNKFIPDKCKMKASDWEKLGFNTVWRCAEYHPGQSFAPHHDSSRKERNKHSYLTFMVYLNDCANGGATNFLPERNATTAPASLESPKSEVVYSVAPRAGLAIVFNHNILHEGAEVLDHKKYILRCEVMYEKLRKTAER